MSNEYIASDHQSSTAKIKIKSDSEQRRTIFVNLRLKNAIIVDNSKELIPQMQNDNCPICQYDFISNPKE